MFRGVHNEHYCRHIPLSAGSSLFLLAELGKPGLGCRTISSCACPCCACYLYGTRQHPELQHLHHMFSGYFTMNTVCPIEINISCPRALQKRYRCSRRVVLHFATTQQYRTLQCNYPTRTTELAVVSVPFRSESGSSLYVHIATKSAEQCPVPCSADCGVRSARLQHTSNAAVVALWQRTAA